MEDVRMGKIISKLDDVLDKLNQIISNQRTLQAMMQEANNKVEYLANSVNNHARRINASIQEQTAIQAYNEERIHAELQFMNTMNIMDHLLK